MESYFAFFEKPNRNQLFENQNPKTAFSKTDPSFENTTDWYPWKSFLTHSIDNKNCMPLQFNSHFDGDTITIYNVDTTDRSSNMIAR